MSGYNGGSTIIRGGQFSSYDPAEDLRPPNVKKRSASKPSKTSKQNSTKIKKNKNPKKILEGARKHLLHIIIDQILAGRDEIKISNKIHPELKISLNAAGSPIAWASSQKEFETLEAQKRKTREKRTLRRNAQQQTVTVEVKCKKKIASPQPASAPKPMVTAEKVYQLNRTNLIQSLVDQMIQKGGALTVPNLDSRLFDELKAATSPLLWLQAQPDYKGIFNVRYLALGRQKASKQRKMAKRRSG